MSDRFPAAPGLLKGRRRLVYPRPAALGLAPPLNAAHIEQVSKRLAGLVVRAQTKNIAVRVFEVHFARAPGIVRGRMAYACSFGEQLPLQRVDITHSDPHPASWIALIAHGEKEMTVPARNRGKRIAVIVPPIHFEAEHADVVVEASLEIVDAQDRSDPVECDWHGLRGVCWRHDSSSEQKCYHPLGR